MYRFLNLALGLIVLLNKCLPSNTKMEYGPSFYPKNYTTCAEFSKNARFNPASVIDEKWFIFYYWSSECVGGIYYFHIPSSEEIRYLRFHLDGNMLKPINWTSTLVLMRQAETNTTTLLVERNDRGMYWQYPLVRDVPIDEKLRPLDVRLKQKGGYIGVLYCGAKTAFIMSKYKEIPPKSKIQEAAATMGYRAYRGRSYLYQGHQWMPIDEANDRPVMSYLERLKKKEIDEDHVDNEFSFSSKTRLGPIYN